MHEDEAAVDPEMLAMARKFSLAVSIDQAFRNASSANLRRWYVETFVYDPMNRAIIGAMGGHSQLAGHAATSSWLTTEHAAIGSRLLFAMDPTKIASFPDLTDPDQWRNEDGVADIMFHVFQPWQFIRYDPEGENWYTAVQPGQWRRHGKGAPGQNEVEHWIRRWLKQMDLTTNSQLFERWTPDSTGLSLDDITLLSTRINGTISAIKKFRNLATTRVRVRQSFERNPIMFLDTNTLNQVRTMAPFANGALALVRSEYTDLDGKTHIIKPGELKPLDIEYMVTNANTLGWYDADRKIPKAISQPFTEKGNFMYLDELQDELLREHCPTYWSFLTHAFREPGEVSAFLRLLGAAMYGTSLKVVSAMIGEPNSGKDTVINWLNYLMPDQVATLPFSAFTPHGDEDRGFAPLRGKRVATVSGEVGEGRGSKLLAERIKTVSSGGGSLRVAEKYEKPSTIWFDGMLFLQGNSVPQISGGDTALYTNRLVAVEFKYPFALLAKSFELLYRGEAPAFAQVLFLNYWQYQHAGGGMMGINPPASWRNFAKQFADASNPHGFLESCITPSTTPIPTTQFHQALSAMVQRFGSPYQVGANFWPKRLRALGYQTTGPNSIRKQTPGPNGKMVLAYYLTIDAERSDGLFTQSQWENILKDAAVTA